MWGALKGNTICTEVIILLPGDSNLRKTSHCTLVHMKKTYILGAQSFKRLLISPQEHYSKDLIFRFNETNRRGSIKTSLIETAPQALESFLYLLVFTVDFLIYKNNKSRYKTALSIQFAQSIANNRNWQPLIQKLPVFSSKAEFV